MRKVLGVIVIIVSVALFPVIYLFGELYDVFWLRLVSAICVIPWMLWWGFYGYNLVLGKKPEEEEQETRTVKKSDVIK